MVNKHVLEELSKIDPKIKFVLDFFEEAEKKSVLYIHSTKLIIEEDKMMFEVYYLPGLDKPYNLQKMVVFL